MKLNHNLHLAYCANVHPGETWPETFASLERWTLKVRESVCPDAPYAIGLRLSDRAARELCDPSTLDRFRKWLDRHGCYVFTINGFPFGQFHNARVKEEVYRPDWTSPERVSYTKRLFEILAALLPEGIEGSVSTLPGSFKEFITDPAQEVAIQSNLWETVRHAADLAEGTGRGLHLGLEPEPFGWFENTDETLSFFERLRAQHPGDPRLERHLGLNYDACHFAVEFEEPAAALDRFQAAGVRLSKIHLSSALALRPTPAALAALASFAEDVYLHQVIVRAPDGKLTRFKDLPLALNNPTSTDPASEWRVHFHVPIGTDAMEELGTTRDHVEGLLDVLQAHPGRCSHLEMETYTWAVLPEPLRTRNVVDQLVAEYRWTLGQLEARGLYRPARAASQGPG